LSLANLSSLVKILEVKLEPKEEENLSGYPYRIGGVGKTTSLLSAHFRWVFIAIKWKNSRN
jgi:hypothetical protein